MKANAVLKDNVHIVVRGPDGEIKHDSTHNTICVAAQKGVAENLLASPSGYPKPGWMAIGTSTPTGTTETDKLGGEVGRNALTSKTRTGAVVTMVGDWAAGDPAGTNILTEAGIFDVVTANTVKMWCSASFGASTLLEDHLGNGWEWLAPEEIGALTSAMILTWDAERDDEGKLKRAGPVYWDPDYQVRSTVEELAKSGRATWTGTTE